MHASTLLRSKIQTKQPTNTGLEIPLPCNVKSERVKYYKTRERPLFRFFLLILIGVISLSIGQSVKADIEIGNGLIKTSLIKLIVNPEKYDGKRVAFVGWLRNGAEDTMVFISKDDADYRIEENGLWIDIPSSAGKSETIEPVRKGCVYVEGTFRKARSSRPGFGRGHMGMCQGVITDVTTLKKEKKPPVAPP